MAQLHLAAAPRETRGAANNTKCCKCNVTHFDSDAREGGREGGWDAGSFPPSAAPVHSAASNPLQLCSS